MHQISYYILPETGMPGNRALSDYYASTPNPIGLLPLERRDHLSATATETIILGPGDIALAHGPDDAVPVSELVQVAQLYADLARRLD